MWTCPIISAGRESVLSNSYFWEKDNTGLSQLQLPVLLLAEFFMANRQKQNGLCSVVGMGMEQSIPVACAGSGTARWFPQRWRSRGRGSVRKARALFSPSMLDWNREVDRNILHVPLYWNICAESQEGKRLCRLFMLVSRTPSSTPQVSNLFVVIIS